MAILASRRSLFAATRTSCLVASPRLVAPTRRLVVRAASASDAADNLKKQAADAAKQAADAASKVKSAAASAASQAADAVKNLKVPDMAQLDVDIKKSVTWNFLVQLALTVVSWGIAFVTSHTTFAKGAGVHPTTALLMVGVLASGYSTFLSYTYVTKLKQGGLDVLQGWLQMKAFYDHLTINFLGAAATILALQAEVGSLMVGGVVKQSGSLAVEALAQASANTLLAHLVSIVFLTFMIRKITAAYQRVLEWGESVAKNMPKL